MNGRMNEREDGATTAHIDSSSTTATSAPVIELQAAGKSYALPGGQTCHALRGLDLRIHRGDYVAVLGKSGSGKSTLLNLIAGLDRATSGSVSVGGTALAKLNENAMARWRGATVGVVFQFFQLLPTLTTIENIVLAMELVGNIDKSLRRRHALDLLEQVGLADQADKLPSTLSGGQQQRAAIARALANDPAIILADEPTGNLDTETAAHINALFVTLAQQGKTLLIVTHDVQMAETAHRVIELKDGAVVADRPVWRTAA
ncbi:MAG: ABC transporter ATP-binding protein [Betaproteobacteria bacterium]